MLGTNPAAGSATTTIEAILVPLKVVFSDGTELDATAPVYGESESASVLTAESPLFQPTTFKPGGTNVGTTQYIDAFQRANFWKYVSTTSPKFHVRFHLTVAPVQTSNGSGLLRIHQPRPRESHRIRVLQLVGWPVRRASLQAEDQDQHAAYLSELQHRAVFVGFHLCGLPYGFRRSGAGLYFGGIL